MDLLYQGAESMCYQEGDLVHKVRTSKAYRIGVIDDKIIKTRTKREAKLLAKVGELGVKVPAVHSVDGSTIIMDFVDGQKVRDVLDEDFETIAPLIGNSVGKIHAAGIVHGDLTTSNMLFNGELYFIDFGLGFVSRKKEDFAVDLHLLCEALESTHHKNKEKIFEIIKEAYMAANPQAAEILERLAEVELRGRHKHK